MNTTRMSGGNGSEVSSDATQPTSTIVPTSTPKFFFSPNYFVQIKWTELSCVVAICSTCYLRQGQVRIS